jgi:hypothetical protein
MSVDTQTPTQNDDLGTAIKPVINPMALVWLTVIGLPGLLLFLILTK